MKIEDTTKSVEVPVSKPFTNPIKRAINKIPSKLEKGVKNFKTNVKKALVDPAIKAGKAYAAGDIPLTIPRYIKGKIPYSIPSMIKKYVNPSRKPQNID